MHAPGTDFQPTLDSIKYLRQCVPGNHLVRRFATFHVYFGTKHIPKSVPKAQDALKTPYNCSLPAPYFNVSSGHLYKAQKKLLYPVNVGRNIARDAALTHFILASDIELYPNPGLVKKFLEMIARNEQYLRRKAPRWVESEEILGKISNTNCRQRMKSRRWKQENEEYCKKWNCYWVCQMNWIKMKTMFLM